MGSRTKFRDLTLTKSKYAAWLRYPNRASRVAAGQPATKAEFAKLHKVDRGTLWRWEHEADSEVATEADLADARSGNADQDAEWEKCSKSFIYFVIAYVMMWKKEGGDPIPFELWDFQKDAATKMQNKKKLIFLKARQMGLSWLAMAYALWSVMFKKNFHVYITSIGLKEVVEQMERIRFMYDNLPVWMQERNTLGGKGRKDNDSVMEFKSGSVIHAISSRRAAGHGAAPGLYILDELARKDNAIMMWRAVKPSIGSQTQVIVVSTANGMFNLYANLWFDAVAGDNDFEPVFYGASEHPEYTPEYLEEQRKDFAGDLQGFNEAFPMKPEDAFMASSRSVFSADIIMHWKQVNREEGIYDKLKVGYIDLDAAGKPHFIEDKTQRMVIWKEPINGHRYCIGVDIAEGLANGDWSVALVLDVDEREVVGMLRAKWGQEALSFPILQLSRWYNDAYLVIEVNKGADIIMSDLKQQVGHLLYCRPVRANIWDKPTLVPGFYTGGTNKHRIILQARRWFTDVDHPLRIPFEIVLDELHVYEDNEGKLGAPEGTDWNDDTVQALALAIEGTTTMPAKNAGKSGGIKWDFGQGKRSWRSL